MAKDPAFLFYPNDWLGGTMGMSFDSQGAYLTLLILQFNKGEFTEKMALNTVGERWEELKVKFETNGDLFWNTRLKEEYDKRKNFSNSRRKNATSAKHMHKHMENENENRNIIEIKDLNLIDLYGEKLIEDFLRYWNEPDKKGKCRWELQKTWDIKGRLITWSRNEINFKKEKPKGKIETFLNNYEEGKTK